MKTDQFSIGRWTEDGVEEFTIHADGKVIARSPMQFDDEPVPFELVRLLVEQANQAARLIAAIRAGTDLRDLKHMVGPSEEENEDAGHRIALMDDIYERNKGRPRDYWPLFDRDQYETLEREQNEFETDYA